MSTNQNTNVRNTVEAYYSHLYRFAYSLAKNEDEAGDLTQQTFLIYAQKGDSVRDKSKLKSWLFTTLYREFLRVRRRGQTVVMQEPEIIEAEAPVVSPNITRQLDAGLAVSALEEIEEIYRAPLTLFYLEDQSYKEISETLELPIGTVMSRLSRGKIKLKEALLKAKGDNL